MSLESNEDRVIRRVREYGGGQERGKALGARMFNSLLNYSDLIKRENYNSERMQQANYLDYNLKNENKILENLVSKIMYACYNSSYLDKNRIYGYLDETGSQLVDVSALFNYLVSVRSSLGLNNQNDVIDQSAVVQYHQLETEKRQIMEIIFDLKNRIETKVKSLSLLEKESKEVESGDTNLVLDDLSLRMNSSGESGAESSIARLDFENQFLNSRDDHKPAVELPNNILLIDLVDNNLLKRENIFSLAFILSIPKTTFKSTFSKKIVLQATNSLSFLIHQKNNSLKEARNVFIVILEEYDNINLSVEELASNVDQKLNVFIIGKSRAINLIKLPVPSKRGHLKIQRITTDNNTEWVRLFHKELKAQKQVNRIIY